MYRARAWCPFCNRYFYARGRSKHEATSKASKLLAEHLRRRHPKFASQYDEKRGEFKRLNLRDAFFSK